MESVTLLRLEEDSRTPIWMIEGHGTGDIFEAVVGEVPQGFTEEIPLADDPLTGRLGLITDTTGGVAADSEQYFQMDELRVGVLDDGRFNSKNVTIDDLRLEAMLNCDLLGIPWNDAPLALKGLYVAAGLAAVTAAVAIGLFGVRLARRIRRSRGPRASE